MQLDTAKSFYVECLDRWNLVFQRAEVWKNFSKNYHLRENTLLDRHELTNTLSILPFIFLDAFLAFENVCPSCKQMSVDLASCDQCSREIRFTCVLCHLPAKGCVNFCLICGHGGHSDHMLKWFNASNVECPTGCGCECLKFCGGYHG